MSSYGARLFPGFSGALYLIHASRNYLECVTRFGNPDLGEPVFGSNACWALRRGEMQWLGQGGLRCGHVHADTGGRVILCVPVTAQGETIGIAYLQSDADIGVAELGEVREHIERLAGMVADRLGIAIANVKLRESLRLQSIRDPLTGLLNRRYLEESLPRELGLARREEQSLAVLMIDVDHFKRFNDAYGHDTGDQALRMVGGLFASQFRGSDIACRFGGEEFAIVLPGAGRAEALARAEQLCGQVRELKVMYHGDVVGTLTISAGIAVCGEHGDTMEALLEVADAALYQAKRDGRDRVVCPDPAVDRSAA
jgi:diguanylate cyclase (GGDEF)-like protein